MCGNSFSIQLLHKYIILFAVLFLCAHASFAQAGRTISGVVTNEKNEPLAGATIVVKGSATGTTTDAGGHYTVSVPRGGVTLVFSYIGLNSQEVSIQDKNIINVRLKANAAALQGVVVVGYGTQSRANVTTSISKLDQKVLENVPYSNAASALEGTIPGLRVQSTSGQPGAQPRIILRGGTSINNPNGATPLYVIDGVIRDNMNDINSADIASIQVLKDAAATAIYGARGSNGVIRIEIQDGHGNPLPGYTMKDAQTIIGNEISRTVSWNGNKDVGSLAGKVIRLHIYMKDADLYSIRFK